MPERYFLTGALGCIGAWTVKLLLDRGDVPVVYDSSTDLRRIDQLLDGGAASRIELVGGDVTDAARVEECVRRFLPQSGAKATG